MNKTLKYFVIAALILQGSLLTLHLAYAEEKEITLAKPTPKQIRFADGEVGVFIHFGLNVFTGQEHGDGKESPSNFNPTQLDAEQWVRTAKAMGAKYVCLTARHEGGFCLWPSKTTDYTIANSPYKNGHGDIVREFVDACRKYGLKPALYHTASHDAHTALARVKGRIGWGSQRDKLTQEAFKDKSFKEYYKQVQLDQMRELLTNYGPISYMWSDHWNAQDPNGVWRAMTKLVAELQPDMVFMGPDSWVPGNETGHVVYPMWNAVNTIDGTPYSRPAATAADFSVPNDYGLLETGIRTGHPLGKYWRVRECTTNTGFSYGGWFWHPGKTYPRTLSEHIDLYYRTVGLGANVIINLPPDNRGLIPDDLAVAAKALGDEIRRRFSNPIAETQGVTSGDVVELAWDKATKINTIVTMENIANGQKIAKYTLEAFVDGQWQTLKPVNHLIGWAPYNTNPGYETIGHKKIDRVESVVTNRIRFHCLDAVARPVELRRLTVYNCTPIKRNFSSAYPYLSGIETLDEVAHGGVRRDLNYVGTGILINGHAFKYGLMTCPVKSLGKGYAEFDLTQYPQAKGMKAVVGIDDGTGNNGSCVFIVEGYKNGQWQKLYQSPRLTGKDDGVPFNITFPTGLKTLRLTATQGGDTINSDHAMWADAQFTE